MYFTSLFCTNLCFLNIIKGLHLDTAMKNIQTCALIRAAREEAGLTREALSEKIGVSTTTIARWEKGENKPFFHEISKLAGITSKSLSYFTGEPEQPTPIKDFSSYLSALGEHGEFLELILESEKDYIDIIKEEVRLHVEEVKEKRLTAKKA